MKTNTNLKETIVKSFEISSAYLLDSAKQQVAQDKDVLLGRLQSNEFVKVPIVGDFSAGKSSLVNCLMRDRGGQDESLLPVDITPETAIAYEIYATGALQQEGYPQEEMVVFYREDKEVSRGNLDLLKTFQSRPGDIAKVYVKSPAIAGLQRRGIVLVDMPGIDSGVQEHNDAILHYIDKGTAFVLLMDAGQGALRTSTLAFLKELHQYNLRPAILVSKMEKKPAAELKEIMEYVGIQARGAIGSNVYVGSVSAHEHQIEDFVKYLDGIQADELLRERMVPQIAAFINKQITYMNMQGDLLGANIQNAEKKISELETKKAEMEGKLINNIAADSPEKSTQDILDAVKKELMLHTEELARMLVRREKPDDIQACILNYIRPVVVNAFKEEGRQYAEALNTVVDEVSHSLQDALDVDKGLVEGIIDDFYDEIVGGLAAAAEILMKMPYIFAKILGWVLRILGGIIPDLLKSIFGKDEEELVAEVEEKIRQDVVRQIVEGMRDHIYAQVLAQQERIRKHLQLNMEQSISNMQESVRMSSENALGKTELEEQLSQLKAAVAQLENLKAAL